MNRRELTRRRWLKHGATIAAFILRCAAALVFVIGVVGGAGYIERGGNLDRGIAVCLISVFLALVLGVMSGALDHNDNI